ncbi:MAG: TonB family protein [Bradyrhizobium sp.]
MNGIDEQKPPRRLWVFAALTAFVLHAGGAALAIAHLQTENDDYVPGSSNAIEIGLDLASERGEASELPEGPDSNASAAAPQLAEQKAELKESELPQDKPTEDVEADRLVTPNESKKPKEDDPKIAAVQTQASTESVAAEETAAQRAEAPARLARATWQKELVAHLDKHKRYPSERQQKAAEISVRFTLDRLGHVLDTSIEKSSGDKVFDEAALAMLRRSDPVPVPPPLVADEGLSFTVPVIFRVKGKS